MNNSVPNVIVALIAVLVVVLGMNLILIEVTLAINAWQDIIGHKVKVEENANNAHSIVSLVLTPQPKDVLNVSPTIS